MCHTKHFPVKYIMPWLINTAIFSTGESNSSAWQWAGRLGFNSRQVKYVFFTIASKTAVGPLTSFLLEGEGGRP
jgi:hypothetical protein